MKNQRSPPGRIPTQHFEKKKQTGEPPIDEAALVTYVMFNTNNVLDHYGTRGNTRQCQCAIGGGKFGRQTQCIQR